MMRGMAVALLLAGACAPVEGPANSRNELAGELSGRSAGEDRSCISADGQVPIQIRGTRTLSYARGDAIWVNRLERDCFQPGRQSTVIVETRLGRYCNGDTVRERVPGSAVGGPTCMLGKWTPYRRRP